MTVFDWSLEPDIEQLRSAYSKLFIQKEIAIPILEDLAERGSAMAAFYLASIYDNAEASSVNQDMAIHWYLKAEQMGRPHASYLLGIFYQRNERYLEAEQAFSKGADKGYLPAVYRLASLYRLGLGVRQDLAISRRLLEAAAAQGHLFSKRDLAGLYLSGAFGITSTLCGLYLLVQLLVQVILLTPSMAKNDPFEDERVLA